MRSIFLQKDKTVFKLGELPLDLFATSLGLAGAPKIKYGSKVEAEKKKNAVREVEEVKALIGVVGSDGDSDEDDEDDEDQDDEEEDQDDEESEQDGDEDDENVAPTDKVRSPFPRISAQRGVDITRTQTKVRTKYDRMFNRKSQTILSSHYAKLIDRSASPTSGGEDDNDLTAPASKVDDDFITLKRRDHALEEDKLPESSYLSKRKLKMGTSKKAMLSSHDNPTKLVFDDEGAAHAIYELGDEEDFRKDGDARAQREQFVLLEAERLRVADVEDKERAKDKRREKKRKMKEYEEEESVSLSLISFSLHYTDFSGCTGSASRWRIIRRRRRRRRWLRVSCFRSLRARVGQRAYRVSSYCAIEQEEAQDSRGRSWSGSGGTGPQGHGEIIGYFCAMSYLFLHFSIALLSSSDQSESVPRGLGSCDKAVIKVSSVRSHCLLIAMIYPLL